MHKLESILEIYKKNLWDFQVQTDHLIPTRKSDLVIVNKKENLLNSEIYRHDRAQCKNQRKWKKKTNIQILLEN